MIKTAAQLARDAGLDSLKEMERLGAIPERTLNDWYKTRPITFARLADGCAVEKKRLEK